MLDRIERTLKRTTRTLRSVIEEFDLDFESFNVAQLSIDTCSNCGFWQSKKNLVPDYDGNPICQFCNSQE